MPIWMNRRGGIEAMKKLERRRKTPIKPEVKQMSTEIRIPAETEDEKEFDEYFESCPIFDKNNVTRVHMQVTIVYCFWNYPTISDDQLTAVVSTRWPDSTWGLDPNGRAKADRRKFNAGAFRCMGGWKPENEEDKHYAKVASIEEE